MSGLQVIGQMQVLHTLHMNNINTCSESPSWVHFWLIIETVAISHISDKKEITARTKNTQEQFYKIDLIHRLILIQMITYIR